MIPFQTKRLPNILSDILKDAIHYSDAETIQKIAGIIDIKNKQKDRKYVVSTVITLQKELDLMYYSQHKDDLQKLLNSTTWSKS